MEARIAPSVPAKTAIERLLLAELDPDEGADAVDRLTSLGRSVPNSCCGRRSRKSWPRSCDEPATNARPRPAARVTALDRAR